LDDKNNTIILGLKICWAYWAHGLNVTHLAPARTL